MALQMLLVVGEAGAIGACIILQVVLTNTLAAKCWWVVIGLPVPTCRMGPVGTYGLGLLLHDDMQILSRGHFHHLWVVRPAGRLA